MGKAKHGLTNLNQAVPSTLRDRQEARGKRPRMGSSITGHRDSREGREALLGPQSSCSPEWRGGDRGHRTGPQPCKQRPGFLSRETTSPSMDWADAVLGAGKVVWLGTACPLSRELALRHPGSEASQTRQ